MKQYRIKCYYEDFDYKNRICYMPQVKKLFWWVDLCSSVTFWDPVTKTKESAMSFIQDIKDTEAKKSMPITYIDVE